MGEGSWYRWQGENLILEVRIQPRASKDELVGPHGDRLKIRITAPPVEGQANDHLIRFLAKSFGVPRSSVTLLAGETGREKRLAVLRPRTLPPGIGAPPSPK